MSDFYDFKYNLVYVRFGKKRKKKDHRMCLIEKIFRLCKVIIQKILERKNLQHYLKLLLFATANIFKA